MSAPSARIEPLPRSLLFVPADDERKMSKVIGSGADLVIIDLEDSVALSAKPAARATAAAFLAAALGQEPRPKLYVRVNGLDTGLTAADLAAVLPARPDGVMLPKANSGSDVASLAEAIDDAGGAEAASLRILAIATETPLALLQMPSFVGCHPRLAGLAWGAEDLGTALGAATARDDSGRFTYAFAHARTLCLVTAAAAGVQAIDGIYANFRDEAGLAREAAEAARDGFTGKMVIHPGQVAAVNAAFTPSAEEIAEAQAIVAAFAAEPDTGVIALGRRMLDKPHLERARRVLARQSAQGLKR